MTSKSGTYSVYIFHSSGIPKTNCFLRNLRLRFLKTSAASCIAKQQYHDDELQV